MPFVKGPTGYLYGIDHPTFITPPPHMTSGARVAILELISKSIHVSLFHSSAEMLEARKILNTRRTIIVVDQIAASSVASTLTTPMLPCT